MISSELERILWIARYETDCNTRATVVMEGARCLL
jgi:hypothetical protein